MTRLRVDAYTVPTTTDGEAMPESDGTLTWKSTDVIVVEIDAGGLTGLGYAYTSPAAVPLIRDLLAPIVLDSHVDDPTATFWRMGAVVRNLGWVGVSASAISAVDVALHDLRARLAGEALTAFLARGATGRQPHDGVMASGSGGFTNYSDAQLSRQLSRWVDEGLRAVKMKIGTHPEQDPARVALARQAIGDDIALFVDANGAYERSEAIDLAHRFAEHDVTWFEEPVSSDDLPGLRLVRETAPDGMRVAAGEYGWTPWYFRTMLNAGAVDTLQADATRCGGVTGFGLAVEAAAEAGVPLSAHTSPALHGVLAPAFDDVVHVEYFHDHVLIESEFFDGTPALVDGRLLADLAAPGHGMSIRRADVDRYARASWRSS
ncbi:enolase C-terminal domain-like protein [Frondihabitans australicus]|uniref:enolase C-terminal domain-like protein n=1 Tax=Frondihabitans australicus TaxID=386892 RepID=UPI001B8614C9|nr:enolase C-terminal domain-like protein [Frondihabitans australicus]